MTQFDLIDPALSGRLCLTLLHSLWQVALLVCVAWCACWLWRERSVERRYAVYVTAMLATLVAMPITYLLLDIDQGPYAVSIVTPDSVNSEDSERPAITSPPAATEIVAPMLSQAIDQQAKIDGPTLVSTAIAPSFDTHDSGMSSRSWVLLAPWIVAFYAAGVALMMGRLVLAIVGANRLATGAVLIPDGPLVEALRSLASKWSMRVVPALARAEEIVVPKVVGLVRPTILLPASAISGMSTEQLEMILAHELAHVRRYDMWVNLLQRLAEVMLFFNPALWYLSRRISTLREYCCDEITCRAQSPSTPERRLCYATALLRVVELAKPSISVNGDLASLAASGRSPSEMRRRVARLMGEPLREPLRISREGMIVLICFGAALVVGPMWWSTQAAPPAGQAEAEDAPDAEDDEMPFEFQLKVVGPNGTPVSNASVEFRPRPAPKADQITRGEFVRAGPYGTFAMTDNQGRLTATLPSPPIRFRISIRQPGFGPYWAGWDSTSHPQPIPREFVAELDKGWSVGGVVVDSSGQPIAGVKIRPSVNYKKRPGDTHQLGIGTRIVTDSDGIWRLDTVPVSMSDVHVAFNHPDYGPLWMRLPRNGFEVQRDDLPSARIELSDGLSATGTVTDELGKPIVGALVKTKFSNDIREARTNEQGVYRLVGCKPSMARVVVSAKGRATDMQEVRFEPDMEPVNFVMKPGGKIRIRVVDEQGNGIPIARIFFQRWRGRFQYFEFDHISQYTDQNGVWEWNEAPLDELVADICRPGGMQLAMHPFIARDEEYVFSPPRILVVSGSVVDAKTKEPVKNFRVIPGLRNSDPGIRMNWSQGNSYEANHGEYRIRFSRSYPAHLVRIEAEGYLVAISRDIMMDEGEVDFDFELEPAEDITATIVSATGKPAANAKIALGVAGSQISIQSGDIDDGSTYATRIDANADGRFSIPARNEPFQLIITHSAGFAHIKSTDGPVPSRITLTSWARVEGTFRVGEKPAANVVLSTYAEGINSYGEDVPNIFSGHDVTTGADGRFVFERAFPGKGRIGRRIFLVVNQGATEVTSSQRVPVEFIAGKTTVLNLGGKGRPVVGKFKPPAEHSERVLWNFALITAQADIEEPQSPTVPEDIRDDPVKRKAWWNAWIATDEGKEWTTAHESYRKLRLVAPYFNASVDRDGSFRIDDMPEGHYVLGVRFEPRAPGHLAGYRFSVPPMEEGRSNEPMDLGTLVLDKH